MPTFCSLAELVDWTHADSPSPQCAYLVKAGSPCKIWMSRKISNEARSVVAKHLGIFTEPSDECTDASPCSLFFKNLATIHLCNSHKKHVPQAIAQWLNELTEKRDSIIAKLKEYYKLGIDDTHTGENADFADGLDLSGNQPHGDKAGSDDEKGASEGGEGVSTLSSQSSLPIGLIRHTLTITKDEVAKDVTCLLESAIETKSKSPGWIYAICPLDLPGIVKVGFTAEPPHLQRFQDHKKCHREFDILMTKLVPYAYRVEQLVLTEFSNKHYELENGCQNPRCKGTYHKELLDVDRNRLLRCLKKWISFVESYPYNKEGQFTKEAKERLPRPALTSYLGFKKPIRGRTSRSTTPKKKSGNQGSPITPPPIADFTTPTSTTKYSRVNEVELNQDGLCAAVEDLQFTPSRQTGDSIARLFSMPGGFFDEDYELGHFSRH